MPMPETWEQQLERVRRLIDHTIPGLSSLNREALKAVLYRAEERAEIWRQCCAMKDELDKALEETGRRGRLHDMTLNALKQMTLQRDQIREREQTLVEALNLLRDGLDAAGEDPFCQGETTAQDIIFEALGAPAYGGAPDTSNGPLRPPALRGGQEPLPVVRTVRAEVDLSGDELEPRGQGVTTELGLMPQQRAQCVDCDLYYGMEYPNEPSVIMRQDGEVRCFDCWKQLQVPLLKRPEAEPANHVAVVVFPVSDGQVWLAERLAVPYFSGYFGGPGGSVEPGEGLLEAAVRELREETGLELESLAPSSHASMVTWVTRLQAVGSMAGRHAEGGSYFVFYYLLHLRDDEHLEQTEPEKHGPWKRYPLFRALKLQLTPGTAAVLEKLSEPKPRQVSP